MYVQCMYNVCHGSWRDFTTAVGAIVCTELNTIFGATFVGHWFEDVFCSLRSHGARDRAWSIIDKGYRERVIVDTLCSLRSHGTRFAYGRLRAQALSQPCLVKGRAKVERFAFVA